MKMQALFDRMVNALTLQNAVSVSNNGRTSNCMYRGDNGNKCAVGHLIPDHMYSRDMDTGMSVSTLLSNFPELQDYLLADDLPYEGSVNFLADMQCTHDQAPVYMWPQRFQDIADRFGLVYSPV